MEHWYNETDGKTEVLKERKKERKKEKNYCAATWSTTKPTLIGMGSNLGLRSLWQQLNT